MTITINGTFEISKSPSYAGRGSKAHHPEALLSLLFYGYATGLYSSRKIEQATYDSVAFRFIAANTHSDHDTIAAFRKRFLGQLKPLFVQILLLAQEIGVLAQAAVDVNTMLIVEDHISQSPNDKQEISPALSGLNLLPAELGKVEEILAETNIVNCGVRGDRHGHLSLPR
jgi:hypothetical protein